jgi:MFS family permease
MLLLYFVPIISAVVGERIGYKKVLLFAFVVYFIGNLLLALPGLLFALSPFRTFIYLYLPVLSIGIAGGAFKPIVSATIAKTTIKDQRNFAYSIYYWMINLGAFLVPLTIGIVFIGVSQVYIPVIFIGSAIILLIALLVTWLFYTEPAPPDSEKSLFTYLTGLSRHMITDWRFTLLLIIYAGFWFLFGQNHSYLPLYMYDFAIMPSWFNAALLAAVNPLVIISTGPFLAKFVEKHDSLHVMILGMTIFIVGFCILGLFPLGVTLILGIIIFSLGEFLTHPNFIAYVSKIAPEDKVAIYMGMIFLPMAVGLPLGNFVGGIMYKNIAEADYLGGPGRPSLYWALNISIVVFVLIMFLLYNRFVAPGLGKREEEPKAEGVETPREEVPEEVEPVKVPASKVYGDRIVNSSITPMVFALMIPVIIFIGYSYGTVEWNRQTFTEDGDEEIIKFNLDDYITLDPISDMAGGGYLEEQTATEHNYRLGVDSEQLVKTLTITITWEDEPDKDPGVIGARTKENQPDTFSLGIQYSGDPDNPSETAFSQTEGPSSNARGSVGIVTFYMEFEHTSADSRNGTGDWVITVTCNDAGDYTGRFMDEADDGNNYDLEVTLRVYDLPSEDDE